MDFYIKKGATLPILKMELIKDGRYDYHKFYEKIQNSIITFTMWDIENNMKRISCKPALCFFKDTNCLLDDEYYIGYQFNERETRKSGKFKGEFVIDFQDGSGVLKVPIRDELFIHILENR